MTASAREYFNRTVGCCGKIEWKKCLLGHEQPYDFITRRANLGLHHSKTNCHETIFHLKIWMRKIRFLLCPCKLISDSYWSQWQPKRHRVSRVYLGYRILVFLFVLSNYIATLATSSPGFLPYFYIYLTNWGRYSANKKANFWLRSTSKAQTIFLALCQQSFSCT